MSNFRTKKLLFNNYFTKMKTKYFSILLSSILLISFSCSTGQGDSNSKPVTKNIIFMIGDGMGLSHVHAAMTANGGSLSLEGISHVGLHKTFSATSYITDSGASGTAMACGKKTYNGAIGVDVDHNELESILKVAERNGLATGLVATSTITHATPAAFIANDTLRKNYQAIAADFLLTDIDVFIGGGLDDFTKREDKRDLTKELEEKGYTIARNLDEVKAFTKGKLAGFTADGANPGALDGRGDMLPEATKKALEILSQDEDGFFIMIEGSQIDWASHANDQEKTIAETLDFDKAVQVALDFAKEDGETLVVITADHETGGMVVLEGDYEKATTKVAFSTHGHTGMMVPVYSYGPGAELFTGIFDNTEYKEKFISVCDLKE